MLQQTDAVTKCNGVPVPVCTGIGYQKVVKSEEQGNIDRILIRAGIMHGQNKLKKGGSAEGVMRSKVQRLTP